MIFLTENLRADIGVGKGHHAIKFNLLLTRLTHEILYIFNKKSRPANQVTGNQSRRQQRYSAPAWIDASETQSVPPSIGPAAEPEQSFIRGVRYVCEATRIALHKLLPSAASRLGLWCRFALSFSGTDTEHCEPLAARPKR